MISFIIPIKNRTKFQVDLGDRKITLELFRKNLEALMGLHAEGDIWEFVVVDFKSTDVDMPSFLQETITKPGCSYKCITDDGLFSRGRGLNIGVEHASHEILFFLDADMMINTRELLEDIYVQVGQNGVVMFPVCYSYKNPQHTAGWARWSGMGNAIYRKSDFIPYKENKKWGMEDGYNYKNMQMNKKQISRKYYGEGFVHQWHPNGMAFKNHFYYNK
jgi:glycosyltransferase involved in cell wall biosynthesis